MIRVDYLDVILRGSGNVYPLRRPPAATLHVLLSPRLCHPHLARGADVKKKCNFFCGDERQVCLLLVNANLVSEAMSRFKAQVRTMSPLLTNLQSQIADSEISKIVEDRKTGVGHDDLSLSDSYFRIPKNIWYIGQTLVRSRNGSLGNACLVLFATTTLKWLREAGACSCLGG